MKHPEHYEAKRTSEQDRPCDHCRLAHYCHETRSACTAFAVWMRGQEVTPFDERRPTRALYLRMFPHEKGVKRESALR